MNKLLIVLKNCVSGLYQLLQVPEGWLSLLALISVTYLALHKDVGDIAFASVMTLIPSILIFTEHRKALVQMTLPADPVPPTQSIKEIVTDISQKGQL